MAFYGQIQSTFLHKAVSRDRQRLTDSTRWWLNWCYWPMAADVYS